VKSNSKKEKRVVEEMGNDLAAALRRAIDGYDAETQRLALAEVLGGLLAPMLRGDATQDEFDRQGAERAATLATVLGPALAREWDDDSPGEQYALERAVSMASKVVEILKLDHPGVAGTVILLAVSNLPKLWQDYNDEKAQDEARDELLNTILQSEMSYAEQAKMYKVLLGITKERMGKKLKKTA